MDDFCGRSGYEAGKNGLYWRRKAYKIFYEAEKLN
jgi:hypothetical protein